MIHEKSNEPGKTHGVIPNLEAVLGSLRKNLDSLLPDHLCNDPEAFRKHLIESKDRLATQRNVWKYGLNYTYESLKQHKDWYSKNQQYVQLKRDQKKLMSTVAKCQDRLSEYIFLSQIEVRRKDAISRGCHGTFTVIVELEKIIRELTRPDLKLESHVETHGNDTTMSIYCDSFVVDITLVGNEGDVKMATLMHVVKDDTRQNPEANADLLHAVRLLKLGNTSVLKSKFRRLVNFAGLSLSIPSVNFHETEEKIFNELTQACKDKNLWSISRAADGIILKYKDDFSLLPLHQISKESKEETIGGATLGRKWEACICFGEWHGKACLQWVCSTPVIIGDTAPRQLATIVMSSVDQNSGQSNEVDNSVVVDNTKQLTEITRWETSRGVKSMIPIPALPARTTLNRVCLQDSSIITEAGYNLDSVPLTGGMKVFALPILLENGTAFCFSQLMSIFEEWLAFDFALSSCFASSTADYIVSSNTNQVAYPLPVQVQATPPNKLSLQTSNIILDASIAIDITLAPNVSPKATFTYENASEASFLCSSNVANSLLECCHCMPVVFHATLLKDIVKNAGNLSSHSMSSSGSFANMNKKRSFDNAELEELSLSSLK